MYLRVLKLIKLMYFYNKFILLRDFFVKSCFTRILGFYNDKSEKIIFPIWLYIFNIFPFFNFILKNYDFDYVYNSDNIIYYSLYDNSNYIYPFVSSVDLFDSNGNKIVITNIIKKYHFSVPLKIIYLN